MVTNLTMSPKMDTLGFFKIKVFRNIGYDLIISVYDTIKKNLSRDSNFILDAVMWQSLVNLGLLRKKLS